MPGRSSASDEDYSAKRAFLQCVVDDLQIFGPVAPDIHPVTILDEMASRSPALAKQGLDEAVNDVLEDIAVWPPDRRTQADVILRQKRLMTATEALSRYSAKLRRILKRGRITSETDYYLLKGVRDGIGFEEPAMTATAERILADFEDRAVAKASR